MALQNDTFTNEGIHAGIYEIKKVICHFGRVGVRGVNADMKWLL